jgi:4-hydroxy-3-methylbut-2-enyl diphosphate reductase
MKVILAAEMGMCFGVRDALRIAETVPDPSAVTIHGELVHNEDINRRLRERGFHLQEESRRETLPATDRVLITAHGISERSATRLREAGKTLIDTTCPLVRRVHDMVATLVREGRFIVIVGQPGHVEVLGIVEDLDTCAVVADEHAVQTWPYRRIGVVAQTTASPQRVETVFARVRCLNPDADVRLVDTICRPTRLRQNAVEDLLRQVEALVVVGGRTSNNTRKLAERAAAQGVPCQHVSHADELDLIWCSQFDTVGLTAGTSTPDSIIQAVHQRLLTIVPVRSGWIAH